MLCCTHAISDGFGIQSAVVLYAADPSSFYVHAAGEHGDSILEPPGQMPGMDQDMLSLEEHSPAAQRLGLAEEVHSCNAAGDVHNS